MGKANYLLTALACAMLLGGGAASSLAGETPAPDGARVYFISPSDGETVNGEVHVRFGLSGVGVAPAGVEKAATGHHHLLIDTDLPEGEALDSPILSDAQHRHFGGGQTEAVIALPAGTHHLQLLLGDHNHIPHNPPIHSERITVIVK